MLRAQGQAEARLAMAEAEARGGAHASRCRSPKDDAAMYLLGLKYLEALPQLAQGKGSTIFLPAEASGVMGALGGLREVLRAGDAVAADRSLDRAAAARKSDALAVARLAAGPSPSILPPSIPSSGRARTRGRRAAPCRSRESAPSASRGRTPACTAASTATRRSP